MQKFLAYGIGFIWFCFEVSQLHLIHFHGGFYD
jgi:hypothetical protein